MTLCRKPRNLNDLARQLNVTAATVSLALRNSPLLSDEVGERIRRTAAESVFFAALLYPPGKRENRCETGDRDGYASDERSWRGRPRAGWRHAGCFAGIEPLRD